MTFIDHILKDNSKKSYPIPGPGHHFHDKKSAKMFDEDEVRSLVEMPAVKPPANKSNTSKAPRAMTFVNVKYQNSLPGPNHYFKTEKPTKKDFERPKDGKFKSYLNHLKELKD